MDDVDRGSIVLSLSGHDKANLFFVVGFEGENYLLLADGKFRPVDHPKKKKRKHCKVMSAEGMERITEKLKTGRKINDAELRKALKLFLKEEVI